MNKETLLRKNNIMVNELKKDRPLLLENILRSIDEYAEYYHGSKVKTLGLFSVSKQSELLIAFLKWRKGEQLTSETITEIDNFLADKSNL